MIFELARDKPTGVCKEVLKLQELVRLKEAAQARFDVDAEKRRVRSELAERERASQAAACAVATRTDAMDIEEENDGAALPDDASTSSEDSNMLDTS